MSYARIFVQNIVCLFIAIALSYYFSSTIGAIYCGTVENCSAGLASVDFSAVVGLLLGYFLFVPLLLTVFGVNGKNWWIAVSTLPILILAVYMEIRLMQLAPMVLSAVVSTFLGTIAHKTLTTLAPSFMSKIS